MEHLMKWRVPGIIGIVVVVLGLVAYFFVTGTRNSVAEVQELDATLVSTYIEAVTAGDFKKAYEECLSNDYRRDISLADFEQAHQQRRTDVGVIQSRKLVWRKSSINLFTRVKEHQVQYELHYPGQTWNGWIVLNNADDGAWRIDGTYVKIGSGLNFKLW